MDLNQETAERTQTEKKGLREYFQKLEQKGIRPEKVAMDTRHSFSAICNWKYGRSRPNFMVVQYLEKKYGIPVA